jgi:hypothetical protein
VFVLVVLIAFLEGFYFFNDSDERIFDTFFNFQRLLRVIKKSIEAETLTEIFVPSIC